MNELNRRGILSVSVAALLPPGLLALVGGCQTPDAESPEGTTDASDQEAPQIKEPDPSKTGKSMKIQYLEIVTPEAEGLCEQYATLHGVTFGEPDPALGGARTAKIEDGTVLAIRGPLRETETPVIRPYVLVEDIEASVKSAESAGAEVALPPMELPGHGTCAIVIRGGIECGFWQT